MKYRWAHYIFTTAIKILWRWLLVSTDPARRWAHASRWNRLNKLAADRSGRRRLLGRLATLNGWHLHLGPLSCLRLLLLLPTNTATQLRWTAATRAYCSSTCSIAISESHPRRLQLQFYRWWQKHCVSLKLILFVNFDVAISASRERKTPYILFENYLPYNNFIHNTE